ncbi:MAG TPA: hypothetical protein VGR28_14825 [Candidatus Thermoplasmatota archaeon]|jgi:hypothetical protein|nr:hypothetical protein [Candidatus Thermoplasmatota archaeon]
MRGILLALLALGLIAVAAPATADTDHDYNCVSGGLPDSLVGCVTHCATHVVADVQALTPGFPPCLLHP